MTPSWVFCFLTGIISFPLYRNHNYSILSSNLNKFAVFRLDFRNGDDSFNLYLYIDI